MIYNSCRAAATRDLSRKTPEPDTEGLVWLQQQAALCAKQVMMVLVILVYTDIRSGAASDYFH